MTTMLIAGGLLLADWLPANAALPTATDESGIASTDEKQAALWMLIGFVSMALIVSFLCSVARVAERLLISRVSGPTPRNGRHN